MTEMHEASKFKSIKKKAIRIDKHMDEKIKLKEHSKPEQLVDFKKSKVLKNNN